jgi:hypothetical protein
MLTLSAVPSANQWRIYCVGVNRGVSAGNDLVSNM